MSKLLKENWGKCLIAIIATCAIWQSVLVYQFGYHSEGVQKDLITSAINAERGQICKAQFYADPNVVENYAAFVKAKESYAQGQVVEKTRAHLMPGADANSGNYQVRELCVAAINKAGPPKPAVADKKT